MLCAPGRGDEIRGYGLAVKRRLWIFGTVAIVLLRNEFITRGAPSVPDDVLVEIVDEVYLPLVRGRGSVSR